MWEWLKNYFDLVNILRVNATKAISYRYSDIKMYGGVSEMKNIHGIEPSSIQLSIRGRTRINMELKMPCPWLRNNFRSVEIIASHYKLLKKTKES